MKKFLFLLTFLIILSPFLQPSASNAQLLPDNRLEMTVVSTEEGVFQVGLNTFLEDNYPGYYIEIKYPDFLKYRNIENGGGNCTPKLIDSGEGVLTIECNMAEGEFLDGRATLGVIEFRVTGRGEGNLELVKVKFGNDELGHKKIFLSSPEPNDGKSGYFFDGVGQFNAVLIVGLVLLISGLVIMIILHRRKKGSKNEQLVMLGMIGLLSISMIASYFIAVGDDFDVREEASVRYCVPICDDKMCGDDGCGGVCGECEDGLTCDEEGSCIVSEEGENVKGVFIRRRNFDGLEESNFEKADVNLDGEIDMYDYAIVSSDILRYKYGGEFSPRSDMNEDQENDDWDYLIFVEMYQDVP